MLLATELFPLIDKPVRQDFVVRTRARREANGLPLMTAELVIAGDETRRAHPAAETYPLHFRKTYFPGRLHGDPAVEFERQQRASRAGRNAAAHRVYGDGVPELPGAGQSYARLTPFGGEPPREQHRQGAEAAAGGGRRACGGWPRRHWRN